MCNDNPTEEPIDLKKVAILMEEGLAGLGILDDYDERVWYMLPEVGEKGVREDREIINEAMRFVNKHAGSNLKLISEKELQECIDALKVE